MVEEQAPSQPPAPEGQENPTPPAFPWGRTIISLIIILGVGFVFYYGYKNREDDTSSTPPPPAIVDLFPDGDNPPPAMETPPPANLDGGQQTPPPPPPATPAPPEDTAVIPPPPRPTTPPALPRTYTNANLGLSIQVPQGWWVAANTTDEREIKVAKTNTEQSLRIETIPNINSPLSDIEKQLRSSSSISNLAHATIKNIPALTYSIAGTNVIGYALIQNNQLYYLTDQTNSVALDYVEFK